MSVTVEYLYTGFSCLAFIPDGVTLVRFFSQVFGAATCASLFSGAVNQLDHDIVWTNRQRLGICQRLWKHSCQRFVWAEICASTFV